MVPSLRQAWVLTAALLVAMPLGAAEDPYADWGGANTQAQGDALWAQISPRWFGRREIIEGEAQDIIRIEAPSRAENDALVPVTVHLSDRGPLAPRIERLWLTVDINPDPLAAAVEFASARPMRQLDTRVRVNGYTWVRAIAETSDGRLLMDKRWVRSRGAGCSAPPGIDQTLAQANLGKMRFRSSEQDGGGQSLQLLISHPNNTGMQRDQLSTMIIPQHYVNRVEVDFNGDALLRADTTFTLSENPSFRFDFAEGESGLLRARATDTRGMQFEHEQRVGAAGS